MTRFATSPRALIAVSAAAMLGLAVPALAAPIEPVDTPHTAYRVDGAQQPAREKKLCIAESATGDEMVTGSLLPHRICKTRAQWIAEGAQIVRQ